LLKGLGFRDMHRVARRTPERWTGFFPGTRTRRTNGRTSRSAHGFALDPICSFR
jgi:hypothetical protein